MFNRVHGGSSTVSEETGWLECQVWWSWCKFGCHECVVLVMHCVALQSQLSSLCLVLRSLWECVCVCMWDWLWRINLSDRLSTVTVRRHSFTHSSWAYTHTHKPNLAVVMTQRRNPAQVDTRHGAGGRLSGESELWNVTLPLSQSGCCPPDPPRASWSSMQWAREGPGAPCGPVNFEPMNYLILMNFCVQYLSSSQGCVVVAVFHAWTAHIIAKTWANQRMQKSFLCCNHLPPAKASARSQKRCVLHKWWWSGVKRRIEAVLVEGEGSTLTVPAPAVRTNQCSAA